MQKLHQSSRDHGILYANKHSKYKEDHFLVKDKKYERGGRLKVKIHILFYEDNSSTIGPK
jgi:hypothetical protein